MIFQSSLTPLIPTNLDEGNHRVQVALYKTPHGGKRVASNGLAFFEVIVGSVINSTTSHPLTSSSALAELTAYAKGISSRQFTNWLKTIFGLDIPNSAYQSFYQDIINNKLKQIPINTGTMDTAYSNKTHEISINEKHVNLALQGHYEAVWVLFHILYEEFGHHIDFLLRNHYSSIGSDAPQDEGAKFAFSLGDIVFQHKDKFTFATFNDSSARKDITVEPIQKMVQTFILRDQFIQTDRVSGQNEYYGKSNNGDLPVCTEWGEESECIRLPGFTESRAFSHEKAGWMQSIAEGNPRYNTEFNPHVVKLSAHAKDAFVREFNNALKAIGSDLKSAADVLEVYLKKALLSMLHPITSIMQEELDKYPHLDVASLDYAFSLNSISDRLGNLNLPLGSVDKLAKAIFKVIGAIAVTFEINVDHYGRVYVGAGGELGFKLGSKKTGHPVTKKIKVLDGSSMTYSMSSILNKPGDETPKDVVLKFLTGLEANASVNLFNLISGGATYAIKPDLYSADFGIAHDFSELSFGGNYSACLNP